MRIIFLLICIYTSNCYRFEDCYERPLQLASIHKMGEKLNSDSLDFFYRRGLPYSIIHAFTDVFLQTNLTDPDSYTFYQGSNCTEVQDAYDNDNRYFGLLKKAALLRSHQLNPFNDTVIGVSTTAPYEISVVIWKMNYIRIGVFIGAIVLFLLASSLVRNVVFYYTSGCSFGILASLLLVAFIVWRIAPKKTLGLPILIGGWSVSLYMLHFAWSNLQSIMIEYQKYVIGYFTCVLLISLAVCYKKGPPTDTRSHDIAQWTLQLVAVILIYFSSQMIEVSIATISVLLIQQLLGGFLTTALKWYLIGISAFWRRLFPKSRRLLTLKEYEEEGENVTKEELRKLREYCRKEENRPWKLAGKVKSTARLSKFVEGDEDHITDDEIMDHDVTMDLKERYGYDDDDDDFNRTPVRDDYDDEEDNDDDDDDDEDGWDEIIVKRSGPNNGSSLRSVRVPRSVSSRLLSPYDTMSQSFDVGYGGNQRRRNMGSLNDRLNRSRLSKTRFDSPPRDPIQDDIDRRRRAMTDLRAARNSTQSRFSAEELARLKEALFEKEEPSVNSRIRSMNSDDSLKSSARRSPRRMK